VDDALAEAGRVIEKPQNSPDGWRRLFNCVIQDADFMRTANPYALAYILSLQKEEEVDDAISNFLSEDRTTRMH